MNKITRWTSIILMISCFITVEAYSVPIQTVFEPVSSQEENIRGFSMQHIVNGTIVDKIQVKLEPWILLQTLKNTLSTLVDKESKPFQVKTIIEMLVSEDFQKEVGPLPPLVIQTHVDSSSHGIGDLVLPQFKSHGTPSLAWQELTGQLTFTNKFDSVTMALQGGELKFEEKNAVVFSASPFTFKGSFDADLIPVQINFVWPGFSLLDEGIEATVKEVVLDSQVDKTPMGVEISKGIFKIKSVGITSDTLKVMLEGLQLVGDGDLQEGLLRYLIQTQINRLVINDATDNNLDITYGSNLEIRHLDAEALRDLQKTAREMQKQIQNGLITQEMLGIVMLGKLMELSPKLLARSPEIALSPFSLKSSEGELQGKLVVGIEGDKVTALKEANDWIRALWAEAEVNIGKNLLNTLMLRYEYDTFQSKNLDRKPNKSEEKQARSNVQKRIKMYLDKKWLVLSGKDYKLFAHFKQGKFTLNGQEIPLPFFAPSEPKKKMTTH